MLFEREVLKRLLDFVDAQGDGAIDHSHEQLVADFVGSEMEPWDEGVLPPGWQPDHTAREIMLEAETVQWREKCQREERERVAAQRLLADRAHYVPREDHDAVCRSLQALDKAYAESMASHLHRDNAEARLNGDITRLKEMLVRDTERLRAKLTKAYEILAGAYPPIPDGNLARVLYEVVVGPEDLETGDWQALAEDTRQGWRDTAERLRAKWSTVEAQPMAYERLAQEWGTANRELLRIETDLQTYAPGLERRIGPDEWMDTSDAVRALFTMVGDLVKYAQPVAVAWWGIMSTTANIAGYELHPPGARQVNQWEAPEPTQPAQNDLSGVLAARLEKTRQRAEGPRQATDADPRWLAMLASGRAGGDEGEDAIIDAYTLGIERGVERGERQAQNATCDHEHGADALVYATDALVFAESSGGQAAAEKLAVTQHALTRLSIGLEREGITPQAGEDSVGVALRALQGWGNVHLGLATTRMLLEELKARGQHWEGNHARMCQRRVDNLLRYLDEDELTYKTADGRAAKD